MERSGVGKSSLTAATQAEAEALALQDAEDKLETLLAEGCELVSCPFCGAITEEMKAYRRKFLRAAGVVLTVGVGVPAALYFAWVSLGIFTIEGVAAAVVGAFFVVAMVVIGVMKMWMPRKGKPD